MRYVLSEDECEKQRSDVNGGATARGLVYLTAEPTPRILPSISRRDNRRLQWGTEFNLPTDRRVSYCPEVLRIFARIQFLQLCHQRAYRPRLSTYRHALPKIFQKTAGGFKSLSFCPKSTLYASIYNVLYLHPRWSSPSYLYCCCTAFSPPMLPIILI